ncbi:MAG TPA: polymer-forming cytoskeletal protein [Terriglobales bacterium]
MSNPINRSGATQGQKLPAAAPSPETSTASASAVKESGPTPAAAPRNAALNTQSYIEKSLTIKGEVTCSESLYIDGRVEGSITLSGKNNRITVGKNGVVAADVNAREVVIMGKVRGNVVAGDRLDIRNDGTLDGDVITQRISIEDGASFTGRMRIGKREQKANVEARELSASAQSPSRQENKSRTA